MSAKHFRLDVNLLVALFDSTRSHRRIVTRWFNSPGLKYSKHVLVLE